MCVLGGDEVIERAGEPERSNESVEEKEVENIERKLLLCHAYTHDDEK